MNKLALHPLGKDHVEFKSTGADIYISLPSIKINVGSFKMFAYLCRI